MEDMGRVCVTGGTGFLGSWLVMKLLNHGYSVNTTVRPGKEVGFLKDLPGASERLSIFEADLSRPQSFEAAIEGCVGVFLVAHPTNDDVETKHSIIGTLNILQMCVDLKTVKRVVYTSSAASAMFENKKSGHIIVNESCWSDLDHIHEIAPSVAEYTIAKTTTEKSAFEFAELHGLDLVTVLPAWIHGPFLGTRCPSSVYTLMAMFFGNHDMYEHIASANIVHVDDVASAHIFLFEAPHAEGRYVCSAVETRIDKLCQVLRSRYPEYEHIPSPDSLEEFKGKKSYELSSRKLLEAGFEYKNGLEEMYDGAIKSCEKLGLL